MAATATYAPAQGRPGVEVIELFKDDQEEVRLEHWAAGANVSLLPRGGIELLVLRAASAREETPSHPSHG